MGTLKEWYKKIRGVFTKKGISHGRGPMHITSIWKLFLICFAVFVMCAAAIGAYFFWFNVGGVENENETIVDDAAIETIDTSQLAEMLADFEERSQNYSQMKTIPPQTLDPSI